MATLGPGWQMMDSFGLWWTPVYEILNLNSSLQGGLNGGGKCSFSSGFGAKPPFKLRFDPAIQTALRRAA